MGSSGSMNIQNVSTSGQAPNQLAMAQNFGGGLPGVGNPLGNGGGYSNWSSARRTALQQDGTTSNLVVLH